MSRLHQRRMRDRREDDVDAAQGRFGPEFDEEELIREGGEALLVSEVHLLLKRSAEGDKSSEPQGRDPVSMPVFKKCYDYCDMFSKYRDEELARKVRQELHEYSAVEQIDEEGNPLPPDESNRLQLSRFEMAQIANLSIESVEEAKVLIPTCVWVGKRDRSCRGVLEFEFASKGTGTGTGC